MFRARVDGDLSCGPGRLKKADEIAENHLRRFIKGLITERHTPRQSDLSPLGEFIGQTFAGIQAAWRGDVGETEKRANVIIQLSSDFHYRQRNLLNEALDITYNIPVADLLDFYQATKTSDLTWILPDWRRMIQPPAIIYGKVRGN